MGRWFGEDGGRFLGEIVGLVFLLHLDLRVGADLDETLGGQAVGAVGIHPETALEGERIVLNHYRCAGGELAAVAAHPMVVIQLGTADAYGNVQSAATRTAARRDGAETGGDHGEILLGDGVREEIRRRVGFFLETVEIAGQLLGKNSENARGRGAGAPSAYGKDKGDFMDSDHCDL